MKNNCFKPDSIPELHKKDISINIGRPSKITPRKPAEQILIEKDYNKLLGHLIIQNETLTQLKKEIEYKLKKLKDEEVSLNLLQKKFNLNDNSKEEEEETEEDKNVKHLELFKKAQKEWEERKQELINGNYISTDDKLDTNHQYMDTNDSGDLTYPLTSTIFTTNDSTFDTSTMNTNFNYPNSENDSSTPFNFNAINDTQMEEPFSLSPTDFSLSTFNLDNIENLDSLDPNLMNLDIDFDMNLLDIDLPNDTTVGETSTNHNNNSNINEMNIDLSNTTKTTVDDTTTDATTNDINYLEPELSNIMKILSDHPETSLNNHDDIINPKSDLSKLLNEIPDLPNPPDTKSPSENDITLSTNNDNNNTNTLTQVKREDEVNKN